MSVDIDNHIKEIRSLIDKTIKGKTIRLIKHNENISDVIMHMDIDLPHDVEIINPEHVIAHLSAGGKRLSGAVCGCRGKRRLGAHPTDTR